MQGMGTAASVVAVFASKSSVRTTSWALAMTDVVFTPVAPEGTFKRRTVEIKNRFTT